MVTAADMTKAVSIFVVTASAEQIPRTCKAIGFSLKRGSKRISLFFAIIYLL
jgi:hypothetical protein